MSTTSSVVPYDYVIVTQGLQRLKSISIIHCIDTIWKQKQPEDGLEDPWTRKMGLNNQHNEL